MKNNIKIIKLDHAKDLDIPKYETLGSAGVDLYAATKKDIIIKRNKYKLIPTGIKIALPDLFEAQIRPRSGIAFKYGVTVLNSPGTIDTDYRGEIGVILINHGNKDFRIKHGMRIAQMIISKFTQVSFKEKKDLDKTKRGSGGFGSTGVK
tara:strand:+ start:294 stop:743 length:450 start_codon:yes stop_codon:yes gene_type:complete